MRQEVAIIGGGAKAAAIAAKAAALRAEEIADVHVTIFERQAIGAHWDGAHGYTDGDQPLCTPAERDLGFPYDHASFGEKVAARMQAEFSWMAHLVRNSDERDYAEWVDGGRRRPSHQQFAAYLRESVARSGTRPLLGEVTGVRRSSNWTVRYTDAARGEEDVRGFDGVVVTSPGPQRAIGTLEHPRYLDGDSFWRYLSEARAAAEEEGRIVILGSGGTAAAIAAWFVRAGFRDAELRMVAKQPTFFTRVSNLFENRIFSDDDLWRSMEPAAQLAFNERLTRGAVWDAVTTTLETATNLAFHVGRASDVTLEDPGDGTDPELVVKLENGDELPAALVVNATGFDRWWFTNLLEPGPRRAVKAARADLEERIGHDLSLPLPGLEGLHVPLVGGNVGPGLTSLMVLGAMADRILKPYVDRLGT